MARIKGLAVNFRFDSNGYPAESVDVRLLEDSILTILKTIPGERVYRPTFGCYAIRLLFANMSKAAALRCRSEARRAIETWEPRVIVDDILISANAGSFNSVSGPVVNSSAASTITLTVVWRPKGNAQQQQKTSVGVAA